MAWAGPRCLEAEILLEAPDDDALVESLARFLWANRNRVDPVSEVGTA